MKVEVNASKNSKNLQEGEKIIAFPLRSFLDMLLYWKKPATVVEIVKIEEKSNRVHLELKGLSRIYLKKISRLRKAEFDIIEEPPVDPSLPLWENLRKKSQELIFLINVEESDKLISLLAYIVNMHQLTDFITNYFVMDFPRRYQLFKEIDSTERGKTLLSILDQLIIKMNNTRSRSL